MVDVFNQYVNKYVGRKLFYRNMYFASVIKLGKRLLFTYVLPWLKKKSPFFPVINYEQHNAPHQPHTHAPRSHLHSGPLVYFATKPQASCLLLRDHLAVVYLMQSSTRTPCPRSSLTGCSRPPVVKTKTAVLLEDVLVRWFLTTANICGGEDASNVVVAAIPHHRVNHQALADV